MCPVAGKLWQPILIRDPEETVCLPSLSYHKHLKVGIFFLLYCYRQSVSRFDVDSIAKYAWSTVEYTHIYTVF